MKNWQLFISITLVSLLMVAIPSCCDNSSNVLTEPQQAALCHPLYKMGDVVDIKPDSEKVVIINIAPEYCPAVVYWVRHGGGEQSRVQEELVYHKEGVIENQN